MAKKDEWAEFTPVRAKDEWAEFTPDRPSSPAAPLPELAKPYDPAEGMGPLDKFMVGAGAAADRAYRGVRGLLPPGVLPKDLVGGTGEEDEKVYREHHPGGWATAGEIGADLALSAIPVAKGAQGLTAVSRALRLGRAAPAVGDVAANALYSAATAPDDRDTAAMYGGGGALAGRATANLMSRALRPTRAGPEAQKLMDAGIQPTFGQVIAEGGGVVPRSIARAEEAATSIPFAGAPIRKTRERAMEQFQRASREAALPPGAAPAAAGSVDELGDAFNQAYGSTLRGAKFAGQRDPFASFDLGDVVEDAARGRPIPGPVRGRAQGAVESIMDALDPATMHTPEGAHFLERRLKDTAYKYKSSPDPDAREYGDLLHDVASSWRREWRGSLPPEKASALGEIDKAFSKFVPVRRAAATGNLASPDAYSPQVLLRAIRAGDKTPNKTNFVGGGMPQQDLATAASKVLGNKLPDSGTAERVMLGGGLSLGSLGLGLAPQTVLAGTALAIYGTAPVQRYLTSNTALQRWLSENLSKMPPEAREQVMRRIYDVATQTGRAASTQGQ